MRFRCSTHNSLSMRIEFSFISSCKSIRIIDCLRCLKHTTESVIILCKLWTLFSSSVTSSYSFASSSSLHNSTPSLRLRFNSRVCTSAMYTSLSLMAFSSWLIVDSTSPIFLIVCRKFNRTLAYNIQIFY